MTEQVAQASAAESEQGKGCEELPVEPGPGGHQRRLQVSSFSEAALSILQQLNPQAPVDFQDPAVDEVVLYDETYGGRDFRRLAEALHRNLVDDFL